MNERELLQRLERLQSTMISVAAGGAKIDDVNAEFRSTYAEVAIEFSQRGLQNPLPFQNLWDWYGRWRTGDMEKYQQRREYVNRIFKPLVTSILAGGSREFQPTGWERVDRTLHRCRQLLANAAAEEDFQGVGLLCRETLISLADIIWDAERHPTLDDIKPSATDAKRKLEAYIAVELASGANEHFRKHARASLDLAVALQHRRTAGYRDAAMCLEGTTSMVNLLAIIQGRRDPDSSVKLAQGTAPAPTVATTNDQLALLAHDFTTDRINRIQAGI